jgi:aspartyl-tRNA(Asn)/glutamyl-tRNA(Gln) amidotransferase subunit C
MLTESEVDRIAHLARLAITPDERARYAKQLSAILDYAAELAEVDIEGIPPTATVLPVRSVMREGDAVGGSLPRKDVLANAPATDGQSFVVQSTFGDGESS